LSSRFCPSLWNPNREPPRLNLLDKSADILMQRIDSLAVRQVEKIHVSHEISRKADIINSCDPCVDVGDYLAHQVAVDAHDCADVGKKHIIDVMSARGCVPRLPRIIRPDPDRLFLNLPIYRRCPPIGRDLY